HPTAARTSARSFSLSQGFCTKFAAPDCMARTAFSTVPYAVIMMTGRRKSCSTRSKGRSAICASPSSPLTAVSTSKLSISSSVCSDSRISASSSMMSTEPAGDGLPFIVPRAMTAVSDMHCLPAQGEIQGEGRPGTWIAFDTNLARMLLDDAVRDGKSQSGSTVLTFFGRRLRGEKRIVNPLNMLWRNARPSVRNPHAHHVAIGRSHVELAAPRHRVLGIEKQVQEDLLQSSRISLNRRNPRRQLGVHLNLRRLELVLQQRERVGNYFIEVEVGKLGPAGAREVQQVVDDF